MFLRIESCYLENFWFLRLWVRDKDTTPEAFASMINYVNRALGQGQFNLDDVEGPQMLFELLELTDTAKT